MRIAHIREFSYVGIQRKLWLIKQSMVAINQRKVKLDLFCLEPSCLVDSFWQISRLISFFMALKVRKSLQALFFLFSNQDLYTKKKSHKRKTSFTNLIDENVPIIAKAIKKFRLEIKKGNVAFFDLLHLIFFGRHRDFDS